MQHHTVIKPLILAMWAASSAWAHAQVTLSPVVVMSATPDAPLMMSLNPQEARQPIPAHDGADYLKTIPGFSVIRKGGVDGDPLLRGLAGSRLPILMDDALIFGGCGNRMDPPTAYVFPESYDRVVVIKGPQSVQNGPGHLAGSVEFERRQQRFEKATVQGRASLTLGSFGRTDQVVEATVGNQAGSIRVFGNHSTANDYQDGNNQAVRSQYERWNAGSTVTLTPSANQTVALTVQKSDGEAAYADRSMDGTMFERDSLNLSYELTDLSPLVTKLHSHVYYHYVDHVMDNFRLRPAPMMVMLMNPDRRTEGGKLAVTLMPRDATELDIGVDVQRNIHRLRMNTTGPRSEDARFQQVGVFAEARQPLSEHQRLITGARYDYWRAQDGRAQLRLGMGPMAMMLANPSADAVRHDNLVSGFARIERDDAAGRTFYAGLGHSERMPDYWELISYNKKSVASSSAFTVEPETNTQLDIGVLHKGDRVEYNVSAFANRLNNYLLIQEAMPQQIVRNVDARTLGFEASASYRVLPQWLWDASLAYVRGYNSTDNKPLAQMPPLEARVSSQWQQDNWSVGALWRGVAAQHRVDIGNGNIVGRDISPTAGFGVFSLNAAYQVNSAWQLSVGVDNVFDKSYAEHLSRTGQNGVAAYTQTLKVNEPGRNAWLKVSAKF